MSDPAASLTLAALEPPARVPLLLVLTVQGSALDDSSRRAVHAEVARIAARNARLAAERLFD